MNMYLFSYLLNFSFLITLFISTLIWKSLSIIIFLYCCMLIWSQISDYTCTTLFWDRCKWLKILIHRYREVGDSWFLQCVAMCFVSLVSKHPLQLNDVVQPAGRSWPSDKSILCIYDVYEWWQWERTCKHFTFDILSVFVDILVLRFTSFLFV